MNIQTVIRTLTSFENRIGTVEEKVCESICKLLEKSTIPFSVQTFQSKTPKYTEVSLMADGETIECLPCGLKSGEIINNYNLISSLTSSQSLIDTPNINFNPKSDAICLSNFYFAPAFAISRRDIGRIMQAKDVRGVLKVEPKTYTARNILIGNNKDPRTIIFAHYDAYFSGATDNASGVAVALNLITENRELLDTTLVVLAGNEELSFDYPIYWGRCFREFKRENSELLKNSSTILVIDSVGDGSPSVVKDPGLVKLAFPIGDVPEILEKTSVITGNFDGLMEVYHSSADLPELLQPKYLKETVDLLKRLVK